MPERQRGRAVSPREPNPEQLPQEPYYKAASFGDEDLAGLVYQQAQELIYATPCDLSTFRLQLRQLWFVAVLGNRPPPELDHHIDTLLMVGEPTALPTAVLTSLFARRAEATHQGPWVERHYRPKQ